MYGATKAAVSALAASLAVEGRARGIHVHAIHPSPVNSRFSSGGGNQVKVTKIEAMDQFYKFATGPEVRQGRSFLCSTRQACQALVWPLSFKLTECRRYRTNSSHTSGEVLS